MATYKIIVAYDGTDYYGWQYQPECITVVGMLQNRFKAVFKQDIYIIGASRTDAGVHALGQVALINTNLEIKSDKLLWAWNNLMPRDILIRKIEQVDSSFHPQRNVKQKTYYYHIFNKRPLPFFSRYGYYPKCSFCPEKLQQALNVFIGTHDFRSFCTGYDKENTVRTIDSIRVIYIKKFGVYRVEVIGHSFLRYMIRRIVGAALDIACSKTRDIEELIIALEQKNPEQNLLTAPAHGLMLYKILYN